MRVALSIDQVLAIKSVAMTICPGDKVTPILDNIAVIRDDRDITVHATDRYRLAELTFQLPADVDDDTVAEDGSHNGRMLVPATLLMSFVGLLKGDRSTRVAGRILLEQDGVPTRIRLTDQWDQGRSLSELETQGNWPPVERLLPPNDDKLQETPAGVKLNLDFVGSLSKLILPGEKPAHAKTNGWEFFSVETSGPKGGPMLFRRRDLTGGTGAAYRCLVQPVL